MKAARKTVAIPQTRVRIGLTDDEADRLARELAAMEQELHEPGLKGVDSFDLTAAVAERRDWLRAAMPAHEVDVGAFEVDIYPVTYADYARYTNETGAPRPDPFPDVNLQAFVTGISWEEALAYAKHYDLDLPSEAEWEVAARNRRSFFTWGDSYFPQGNVAFQAPVYQPYVVGTRAVTKSASGVHDLLGQFGEYCKDKLAPYPGADVEWWDTHMRGWRDMRVVRGGYDVHQDATCVSRRGVPAHERRKHLKFRCVRRG